jgi:hypothetical protein
MKMKSVLFTIGAILNLLAGAASATFAQSQPIRVGILDFKSLQRADYRYQGDINQVIANKIEGGLVSLSSYKMVERNNISTLNREFDLINSGVIDKQTAARLGRVHGADAIIYGSINEFSISGQRDDGQYRLSDLKVTLKVQVKMTQVESWNHLFSNEFVATAPVAGQALPMDDEYLKDPGKLIDDLKNWGGILKKKRPTPTRMNRPDGQQEIAYCNQLVNSAVDVLVASIISKIQSTKLESARYVAEISSSISGNVLAVRPGNIVMITGINRTLAKPGDRLRVKRTEKVQDPTTGKLVAFDNLVGEVEVLEIQDSGVLRARFSSSTDDTPKAGDKVTN